jgi:DNA mismatch repair protein MutL
MHRIAVLPVAVANQIAAGEVVERPASVVKELVENSLDAGATRITVVLRGGGRDGIIVRDDGEAMGREDAVLAFSRHATSKLRVLDDLPSIGSFGFRGEALPSIAAAADVELLTRRRDEQVGTRVRTRGGEVVEAADAGCPPGTQVAVQQLFATLPARQKFLKRPATELGHVAEMISRLALAVPRVGFVLEHDGREVLSLPPVASATDRLHQVLGKEGARDLVELSVGSAILTVRGHLGRPQQSLSSARLVLTYVNGRFVRDRVLTRAVLDGYESLLMRGRYPIAVVFLQVAPGEVDVNVHPTKAEVRFREPGRVHRLLVEQIRRQLRLALGAAGGEGRHAATPERPGSPGVPGAAAAAWSAGGHPPFSKASAWPQSWSEPTAAGADVDTTVAATGVAEARGAFERSPDGGPESGAGMSAAAGEVASFLPVRGRFGSLRVLGQILDCYLVCSSPGGLVLIDQHAAHERVRFERLREQLAAGRMAVQHLLVPETLSLGAHEVQALEDVRDALTRMGFEGEPFGDGIYLLRGVPATLADADCAGVLRDLAAELAAGGASRAVDEAIDGLLARVACHSAIRMGRRLEVSEAEALLAAMDRIDLAGWCPHGRPAFIEIDAAALERMFKR